MFPRVQDRELYRDFEGVCSRKLRFPALLLSERLLALKPKWIFEHGFNGGPTVPKFRQGNDGRFSENPNDDVNTFEQSNVFLYTTAIRSVFRQNYFH